MILNKSRTSHVHESRMSHVRDIWNTVRALLWRVIRECSGEGTQHLLGAAKRAFSARWFMSLYFGICYFSKIFWNSDYRQRFPIKPTDIWRYGIQLFCVLSFHLQFEALWTPPVDVWMPMDSSSIMCGYSLSHEWVTFVTYDTQHSENLRGKYHWWIINHSLCVTNTANVLSHEWVTFVTYDTQHSANLRESQIIVNASRTRPMCWVSCQ